MTLDEQIAEAEAEVKRLDKAEHDAMVRKNKAVSDWYSAAAESSNAWHRLNLLKHERERKKTE